MMVNTAMVRATNVAFMDATHAALSTILCASPRARLVFFANLTGWRYWWWWVLAPWLSEVWGSAWGGLIPGCSGSLSPSTPSTSRMLFEAAAADDESVQGKTKCD